MLSQVSMIKLLKAQPTTSLVLIFAEILTKIHQQHQDEAKSMNVCSATGLSLFLDRCQYTNFSLLGIPLHLNGLHFGPEDNVPTRLYQELATRPVEEAGQITSLSLPKIPQMFVPLILTNHGNITGVFLKQSQFAILIRPL